jgi:cytoskeletal protein CcmA (bactofilin family)
MFKSKKQAINPNTTDTLVGEGTIFEGKIKSAATVRIEGQQTGDIDCTGDVIVGENGRVRSNISARDVVIAGHVQGNVSAKGKISVTSTGTLNGNILTLAFTIEEGGVFQGTSKMESPKPANAATGESDTGTKSYNTNSGYNSNSAAM